jgi:hypothetical protein
MMATNESQAVDGDQQMDQRENREDMRSDEWDQDRDHDRERERDHDRKRDHDREWERRHEKRDPTEECEDWCMFRYEKYDGAVGPEDDRYTEYTVDMSLFTECLTEEQLEAYQCGSDMEQEPTADTQCVQTITWDECGMPNCSVQTQWRASNADTWLPVSQECREFYQNLRDGEG